MYPKKLKTAHTSKATMFNIQLIPSQHLKHTYSRRFKYSIQALHTNCLTIFPTETQPPKQKQTQPHMLSCHCLAA